MHIGGESALDLVEPSRPGCAPRGMRAVAFLCGVVVSGFFLWLCSRHCGDVRTPPRSREEVSAAATEDWHSAEWYAMRDWPAISKSEHDGGPQPQKTGAVFEGAALQPEHLAFGGSGKVVAFSTG